MKRVDLTGQRFGRLTVLEHLPDGYVMCRCECGESKRIYVGNMRSGKSKSCGCLNREMIGDRARTHGKSKTKEYAVWARMWARCTNPTVDRYPRYGGRGIVVCERWKSFENFLEDMGPLPTPQHSIGRLDNDANYAPDNCRWETRLEQANNTSTTVFIEFNGVRKPLQEWARETGIPAQRLTQRFNAGMSPEQMFDCKPDGLTPKPIVVDGVSKLTTEWMKDAGIPISSFYHHRRKGLTEEQIVRMYLAKQLEEQE